MHRWTQQLGLLLIVAISGCRSESDRDPPTGGTAPGPAEQRTGLTPRDARNQPNAMSLDRQVEIESSERLLRSGQKAQAAAILQQLLLANPDDIEVLFRLANVQASLGRLEDAVTMLQSIPEDHPEAGLAALGQSADWCLQLERYDQAEQQYSKILERVPNAAEAHRQLAYLYNRQGRTHEAADHIHQLCALGNVRQDELQALIIVSHAVYDDPAATSAGTTLYDPIGAGGTARKLFTDSQFREAADLLQAVVAAGDTAPAINALYGRLVAEGQDDERFLWWLAGADETVKRQAEYWAAVGTYLLNHRRHEEAIRALAEAIDRDPTDVASIRRMNQALLAVDQPTEADKWNERFFTIRDVTVASNRIGASATPDFDAFATVADGLDKLQRPLEATMWRLLAAYYRAAPAAEKNELNQKLASLVASGQALPNQHDRLCGLDYKQYPLPKIDLPEQATAPPPQRTVVTSNLEQPVFQNVASRVGLTHAFQVASKEQAFQFAIYQQLGGGVAVLDFDLDGWPDLYFAQGGSDPPLMTTVDRPGTTGASNALYRNLAGQLVDTTSRSATSEQRYSIGVTAGDWNQDGFPDLAIASMGAKTLLVNHGDGTFGRELLDVDEQLATLPSSLAMADVTGDALPDIVALHYIEDRKMLSKPAINAGGQVQTMSPNSFTPGTDRVYINDGTGAFSGTPISNSENAASTGLGLIIADLNQQPGNDIFVGNDVRANQLWSAVSGSAQWTDTAPLAGCALGGGGLITASMGIAAGDFDGSSTLDLYVTNFYLEPASFFLSHEGAFEDRCIQYQLYRDSTAVLGFGSQSVDYNNDGRPDLAVTNGNIEKAAGEPFQQPPQLFANLGSEFRLTKVTDASNYWSGNYLGRGLARLDFDGNGKSDIVITHLDAPSALLLNETETGNHWLKVKLVGTDSERDAIGAKVTLRAGDQSWTNWAVGGDGYLCRNEAVVPFGLGPVTQIDQIEVHWPTGKEQVFPSVVADQLIVLVEQQPDVYSLSEASPR